MIYGQRSFTGPDGLPWLQFDNFIKRTKITLTDTEDTIVFYNQLYNIANHYGVFLRPLQGLKLNMSLCPDSYNGIAISDSRKMQMGECLYQILQNPDVIPLDFTWARNVINRFVEDNDGYKVLYVFVEPLINQDVVSSAPGLSTCNDIHEYAKKLNSFIKCEALAGRWFKPKEKVNLFLKGMDVSSYRSSIIRVRQLLDGVNSTDMSIPDVLKPDRLPETIERFYREETGQSTVRAMSNTRLPGRKKDDTRTKPEKLTETAKVNKPCGTCLAWGHLKSQCNGFARYILFREADKTLDDVTKSKLVDRYRAEMRLKAEAKMKQQKLGTVRQMWEQGYSYEEMEENLLSMVLPEGNINGYQSEVFDQE
jgi:hypothetical protein